MRRAPTGESEMGRYELPEIELALAGPAPMGGEALFELGMMYAAGNSHSRAALTTRSM